MNPATLVPIGDLSKELLNHLATSEDLNKKLKEEIESGKFELKAKEVDYEANVYVNKDKVISLPLLS